MCLFCSYSRAVSERRAFRVCSVLFASRSGEHLKHAKGGRLRRAGSALPHSLRPTHTHLQLHKHQGSGIRKPGHVFALLHMPSVKREAKSLKPALNLSISHVLHASCRESSSQPRVHWTCPARASHILPQGRGRGPGAHRHRGLRGPSVQRLCPAMGGQRRCRHIQDGAHSCTFASEVLRKQR